MPGLRCTDTFDALAGEDTGPEGQHGEVIADLKAVALAGVEQVKTGSQPRAERWGLGGAGARHQSGPCRGRGWS